MEDKIKQVFPDASVMKSGATDTLFAGRNLPVFVRDYILRRFSDEHGNVDKEALTNYFDAGPRTPPCGTGWRLCIPREIPFHRGWLAARPPAVPDPPPGH